MVVMIMPVKSTNSPRSLLSRLRKDFPTISFDRSNHFSWHAGNQQITYRADSLARDEGSWALLHELGHAQLEHADFESDIELLQIEAAAWQKAQSLAQQYNTQIDDEYIQESLDSYRDWLHVRSTCPSCQNRSLQLSRHSYRCHNCYTEWSVSRSRLCRPYRRAS